MQTPFTEAAQCARENAARGGQPLLCGKAVHIMKGAAASGDGSGVALARMAQAHGAKVGSYQLALTRNPPASRQPFPVSLLADYLEATPSTTSTQAAPLLH